MGEEENKHQMTDLNLILMITLNIYYLSTAIKRQIFYWIKEPDPNLCCHRIYIYVKYNDTDRGKMVG